MIVIYKIQSKVRPYKFYIGSTICFYSRFNSHINSLKRKKHKNPKLQSHFNKYGIEDLDFSIIEEVENKDILIEREQYWLDKLKPIFNVCKTADRPPEFVRDIAYRAKMSAAKKGKPHRSECSAEKSKRQKGRKPFNIFHTEATKLKISLNSAKTRKVIQMDLMGNFIKEWDKIKIAAIELHMHSAGISMCCRGILKQSGGFKWKYSQIRETDKIK